MVVYWVRVGNLIIMNFSEEYIESNKNTFIELLNKVTRKGANIEGLISKLENSDFFIAPASTKWHNAVKGGLVDHSLNVYYNLKSLVKNKHLEEQISEESIIICGLLHDLSKMNFYEPSIRNVKVYSDNGSKYDNLGRFDWVAEETYQIVNDKKRFQYGNHEENSEFMIRCFIPLTLEESIAILHHHGGKGFDSTPQNISYITSVNPLLALLHAADYISTFVDEYM